MKTTPLKTKAEAVELVIGLGYTFKRSAQVVGVTERSVSRWVREYRGNALKAAVVRQSKINISDNDDNTSYHTF